MRVIFLFKVTRKPKQQPPRDGRRNVPTCVLVSGIIANANSFCLKLALKWTLTGWQIGIG
jgi:hypothetical protein